MKRVGKKTLEWWKERRRRIGELKKTGEYVVLGQRVYGMCPDCGHHHPLTADHLIKRSQGGGHNKENIEWVCNTPPCMCHDKRDNQGDPMKKKPESKKPAWMKDHKCKNCGVTVAFLLCPHCKRLSA